MDSPEHLVACSSQEAMAIFAAIRDVLPVVKVFFELGRKGESIGLDGLEALRLADILRHVRLPGMPQLAACLEVIDRAFRQIRDDEGATLNALDRKGYCVIAMATQQSIMNVWNQLISAQKLQPGEQQADRAKKRRRNASSQCRISASE